MIPENLTFTRSPGCESNACPEAAFECGESSHCAQAAFTEGRVYIRDSERPEEIIWLNRRGWQNLMTIKPPEEWL